MNSVCAGDLRGCEEQNGVWCKELGKVIMVWLDCSVLVRGRARRLKQSRAAIEHLCMHWAIHGAIYGRRVFIFITNDRN